MCEFISGVSVPSPWSVHLLLYKFHAVFVTVAWKYCLKSGQLCSFLHRIGLVLLGFYVSLDYSSSVKIVMGTLTGMA